MSILIFNASKCKGFSFYMKNKLNPEIFNEKKKFVKKNIFLSLMTKNLNWEILTENLFSYFWNVEWGQGWGGGGGGCVKAIYKGTA